MAEISVIVPVYNVEKYIRRCIDSLIVQSFENIEILLIDDGSEDGSGAICDEYAVKDSRIRVIHKKNGGVSSARNVGLDIATGVYVMFCDPDDYVDPSWCEKLYNAAVESDAAFCVCCFNRVNVEDGKIINTCFPSLPSKTAPYDEALLFLFQSGFIRTVWNDIFCNRIIKDNKLRFNEAFMRSEDATFVMDYLQLIDGRLGFIGLPLYNYSVGKTDSLTHKAPPNYWESELFWLGRLRQIMQEHNIDYSLYREKYCSQIIYAALTAMHATLDTAADTQTMFKCGRKIMGSAICKEAFRYGSFHDVHPLYKAILKTHSFFLVWLFDRSIKLKHRLVG